MTDLEFILAIGAAAALVYAFARLASAGWYHGKLRYQARFIRSLTGDQGNGE